MTTTSARDVRALFDRYAEAWAKRDPDAIAALHTEDTQFRLRSGGTPIHGRGPVREAFAAMFVQWPEFGFDVHRIIVGQDHWILDWALTAVLTNPDGTTRPVRFDCLDVVMIDTDGLVTRKDTFVDLVQANAAMNI